jgi:hypothetical protein
MSYAAIETALVSRIITSTDFSSSYVTTGDHRVLAAGVPRAVIAQYGGLVRQDRTFRWVEDEWMVNLHLYTLYTGQMEVLHSNMDTNRQTLIDTIEKWPALNGSTGVYRAKIASITMPVLPNEDSEQYGLQTVVVSVKEIYDPGRLEA